MAKKSLDEPDFFKKQDLEKKPRKPLFDKFKKKTLFSIRGIFKKPFKIAIISPQYPSEDESSNKGVAIHTYYLSRELANLECEVHVFTCGKKDSIKEEHIGNGKRVVHRIDTNPKFNIEDNTVRRKFQSFSFDSLAINEIFKENARRKFDVIHSQINMSSGLIVKYLSNVDWIHTFHSLEKLRGKFNTSRSKRYLPLSTWMQSAVVHPDAIISVSQSLKKELIKAYPDVKEKKIFYIPNGVDLEVFNPKDNQVNDKRVLFVARFSLEKGIDIIAKIASRLLKKDNEIKMEVVIPLDEYLSEDMEKIKNEFELLENQFSDRFIWHKKEVGREELSQIFNRCMVYIQPSRYESFGMTVLEAMACRKAVVVSNKGGMPEVVGNAGEIIPLNTNSFVKRVSKLLEDYKLRERYSRRAIERAKTFSWQEVGKKTLDLYKAITRKLEDYEDVKGKISDAFQILESEKEQLDGENEC